MKKPDYSLDNLTRAWKDARVADAYGRDRRREIIRQYVGPHWNEQGADIDIPLNLLSLYVQIVSRSLIGKDPRVMLATFDAEHKAACGAVQEWGNRELRRMKAAVTFRRIVIDGLAGVGIGRVALATPAESAGRGWGPRGGEPIFTRVDREDFAYDSFAGDFSECAWLAHRYRVPLEAARQFREFRPGRKDLQESKPSPYDEYGLERMSVMGRSYYGNQELEPMVDLWEFYLPRHRLVVTLQANAGGNPVPCADGKPLREQPWVGPEGGPYYFLGYQWVPGNAMPKGPLQDLFDAHCAANQFYRKSIGATERMKEITVYQNAEDARRVRDEDDGGTTFVERPDQVQTLTYGGGHVQATYGAAQAMRELFDFMGGNLALLGGRSQAATAHQEALLNQNAQGSVEDMQETTTRFADDVLRGLCWYWWKHPYRVMESHVSLPGIPGVGLNRRVYPRGALDGRGQPHRLRRDADFDALDIQVDAYSLSPRTPAQKLQMLRDIFKADILPAMPMLQQQGIMLDFHAYIDRLGLYTDDPDFAELLTIREPVEARGGDGGGGMPAQTERTYKRISGSEKTDTGQGRSQISQLLSGNDQGGAREPVGAMG